MTPIDLHGARSPARDYRPRDGAFAKLSDALHRVEHHLPHLTGPARQEALYDLLAHALTEAVMHHSLAQDAQLARDDAAACAWVADRFLRLANGMTSVRVTIRAKRVPHAPADLARAFAAFHTARHAPPKEAP